MILPTIIALTLFRVKEKRHNSRDKDVEVSYTEFVCWGIETLMTRREDVWKLVLKATQYKIQNCSR